MLLFFLSEIIEELADSGIICPLCGGLVKAPRFKLHQSRFFAGTLGPERSREPRGAAHDKALHILPPDERNMFTEPLAIQLDQSVTVAVLFSGHSREQF